MPKITSFFSSAGASSSQGGTLPLENVEEEPVSSSEELDPLEQRSQMSIDEALAELSKFTMLTRNAKLEARMSSISKFDLMRYMAIQNYLVKLQPPHHLQKMTASREVAASLFPKRGRDSMSRKIRRWAKNFLHKKMLDDHQQGKHVKTKSLIEEEDIQISCRTWLRSQKHDFITALSFSKWIGENLHQELALPRPVEVSKRTATRWLHRLNLDYKNYGKGLYKDGHEKDSVVVYRNAFLDRMNQRLPFMVTFEGEDMMTEVHPDLTAGRKRIVMVTHDECCFSSHDGKRTMWMNHDGQPLRPKGDGRSIMVSEFLCECHGPMKLSEEEQLAHPEVPPETVRLIKPGKADGYWTNKDLVEQLESRAIPIFKILHPECIGLFMFDNSMNHHAYAPDALRTVDLPLKDGGKRVKILRDGWFEKDSVRFVQKMQWDNGTPKGLDSILKERGLWNPALRADEARKLIQQQPDFQAQKEWLEESVTKHHYLLIDYYPKFHCEFNFIELYWGAAKRYSRSNCNYSFAGLQRVVPLALNSVPLSLIRSYARKCFRYMDAYRVRGDDGTGLTMQQVEYAVKKYRSHRCIPASIMAEIDRDYIQ